MVQYIFNKFLIDNVDIDPVFDYEDFSYIMYSLYELRIARDFLLL